MTKKNEISTPGEKRSAKTPTGQPLVISDLTVQTIEKTKVAIDEGLEKKQKVEIIAEKVESIDLSYIQLILALNKSCDAEKVSFTFKGAMPAEIRKLLDQTGFSAIK